MQQVTTLIRGALDFAVGVSLNGVYSPSTDTRPATWFWPNTAGTLFGYTRKCFEFSSDYKHIALLLKVAGDNLSLVRQQGVWTAELQGSTVSGDTLQEALCSAIVLREMGTFVEVPKEYKE